jgi:hypothetical protein
MTDDYYSVLARTISAVGQDQTQLRLMIYKFARSELKSDLFRRKGLRLEDVKQQMAALEWAIDRIEADIGNDTKLLAYSPEATAAATSADTAITVRPSSADSSFTGDGQDEILPPVFELVPHPVDHTRILSVAAEEARVVQVQPAHPVRAAFWSTVQLVVAVVLGVALFSALQDQGNLRGLMSRYLGNSGGGKPLAEEHTFVNQPDTTLGGNVAPLPVRLNLGPKIGEVALPSSYGVYAVSHGKLIDLQMLSIKVPDQRVSISAVVSAPPAVTLPDGQVEFVAFRRDLAANAPDQATVRIVARVKRSLSFDAAGKPRITEVDGAWAVRSNSYAMKVAPVNGNPEMILIRPEDPKFSFPAGRYVLMLKGLAYDFSVEGPITDMAQCLERTDALNAPVYSECRGP